MGPRFWIILHSKVQVFEHLSPGWRKEKQIDRNKGDRWIVLPTLLSKVAIPADPDRFSGKLDVISVYVYVSLFIF